MSHLMDRNMSLFLFFLTLFVVGFSFYSEYVLGFQPCPLCLMQRLCACFCFVFCGMGFLHPRRGRFLLWMQGLFSAAGLFFALRQLWLQFMPMPQGAMCMPGLDRLMHYFSWNVVLKALFWGTTDCSGVVWTWLGVSMPMWSTLYFFMMVSLSGVLLWRKRSSM